MPHRTPFRAAAIIVLLCLGLGSPAHAALAFSQTVVFGDSLSDVGNVNFASFGLSPDPTNNPDGGRFSNGPLWVEYLAADLGLPPATPSRTLFGINPGTNYAHGGATTADGTQNLGITRNLGRQIDDYIDRATPAGDELFVVFAGGNDIINGGFTAEQSVGNLAAAVSDLAAAGARNFLLPNLPPVGALPRYRNDPADASGRNAATDAFNSELAIALDELEQTYADVLFISVDLAGLFDQIDANPSAFGITNATDPLVDAAPGTDTTGYLYWDGTHPSTLGHELIGQAAFRSVLAVPEPATGTLVVVASLIVSGRRRFPAKSA